MTAPDHFEVTESQTEETLYCTVHPTVATHLRCNRCGRPMCTRCAVKTPVGYRCRECVRSQQDKFFDARALDYLIAGAVSLVLSFFAALVVARLGWFLFAFFLSPAAGGLIGRAVWWLTGKRRGRYMAMVVGANVVLGALPSFTFNPLAIGIYLFMATGAAVAQFRLHL
jgi:hypothetical protein